MKISIGNLMLFLLLMVTTSAFTPVPDTVYTQGEEIEDGSVLGGAYLVFAGKMGGDITRAEIQSVTSLGVDGCARGSKIFSYRLEVYDGNSTQKFAGSSQGLTREMIQALSKLEKGDSFEFKALKAHLPNGKDVVDVHAGKFNVV